MIAYSITAMDHLDGELETLLRNEINAQGKSKRSTSPIKKWSVALKSENGEIVGGATGMSYSGCIYTDLLWVTKQLRGQTYGTKIMQEVEKIGRARMCLFATVNTMDWEALPFYLNLGYELEFTREGYENGAKIYFLRKDL